MVAKNVESTSESGIFKAAINLPADDRAAYLEQACGTDAELRRDVESLLRAHDDPSTLMQESTLRPDRSRHQSAISERPSAVIGPYTLVEQIGEGGMGVVFRAEQSSPVRRIAALKVIKPGMDSEQFIARLEAERQALALMDHPAIAKFLDAGTTDFGRPFFVMELVDGIAITEYCDRNRLALSHRLELFALVCQAIQHAHQKGIIHRDIKPTNVLVALRDGKPTPKVIDFGVAKAIDQRLTEKTLFTQLGTLVGTFEYMSPEQAEMGALDVDTRSDIYSLGVLLYELLTGETPLDRRRLRGMPFNDILRVIREEDPLTPSKRLAHSQDAAVLATARGSEPSRLIRDVRGDLDWIVMKCLEKDPASRYETASTLVREIRHYLAGDAVEAGPPSARYRLRKFASKHRAGLATAAGFVAVLIAATAISSWEAIRAIRAEAGARFDRDEALRAAGSEAISRNRAEAAEKNARLEADKALAINRFLTDDLLSQAEPERNAVESNVTVRELLDRASSRASERFRNQPEVDAEIQKTIAATYHHLGIYDQSQRHWRTVLELATRTAGGDSPKAWVAKSQIAHLDAHLGRRNEAIKVMTQANEALVRLNGVDAPESLVVMEHLASAYEDAGDHPKAISLLEQVLRARSSITPRDDSTMTTTVRNLASVYNDAGRLSESIPLLENALKANRAKNGVDHPDTIRDAGALLQSYRLAGRFSDAISLGEDALKLCKSRFGPDHPETVAMMNNLAVAYSNGKREQDAVLLLEPAYAYKKFKLGAENPETLRTAFNLAVSYDNLGQPQKALPLFESVIRVLRAATSSEADLATHAMIRLGNLYQSGGKASLGLALFEEAYGRRKSKLGASNPETLEALYYLAMAHYSATQFDRAIPLFDELCKERTAALGLDDFKTWVAMHLLAVTYRDAHQSEKAIPLLETLVARQKLKSGSDDFQTLVIEMQLLATYLETKRWSSAEATARQCLQVFTRNMPDYWHRFSLMSQLGAALAGQKKYDQAERLLLEGFEGMKAREAQIPQRRPTRLDKSELRAGMTRLVALYEATGNDEKAAAWRAKLGPPAPADAKH